MFPSYPENVALENELSSGSVENHTGLFITSKSSHFCESLYYPTGFACLTKPLLVSFNDIKSAPRQRALVADVLHISELCC